MISTDVYVLYGIPAVFLLLGLFAFGVALLDGRRDRALGHEGRAHPAE